VTNVDNDNCWPNSGKVKDEGGAAGVLGGSGCGVFGRCDDWVAFIGSERWSESLTGVLSGRTDDSVVVEWCDGE